MNVTLVCENNIEGIMTAIYDGWVYMNKGYSVNIHQPFFLNLLILKLTILRLKELFAQ
jgi:hypothetical protein